jgi:hypothetical protein
MTRLAYALMAIALATAVPGAALTIWLDWTGPADLLIGGLFALLGVASAVTGALVASRVNKNAVGWLILALGVGMGILLAANAYASAKEWSAFASWPGHAAAAWVSSVLGIPVLYGVTGLLLLLFPTGRPLSPRWGVAVWAFGTVVSVASISYGLSPGDMGSGIDNPLALPGPAGHAMRTVADVTDVLALPAMLMCAVCLVVRLRRSRGVERQQLKWFTYAAALTGLGLGVTVLTHGVVSDTAFGLGMFGLVLLPTTAGIAILRYRLYEIDVVIKRTLVYGLLTAMLVAIYVVTVLALRAVLDPLTGTSDLAVAASTLAVAAMFRPLRARVQELVDRRFFRHQYDATRTLERFTGRLRQQVDLDAVSTDLRSVVRDTMQPAHVTLWLRSQS